MDTILLLLIIFLSVLYVAWPYLPGKMIMLSNSKDGDEHISDLFDQQDNLIATIKDIEFDHEMGKISTEDFNEMNSVYRDKTIKIIKEIEELKGGGKSRKKNKINIKQLKKEQMNLTGGFCAKCGTKIEIGDSFCRSCGQQV